MAYYFSYDIKGLYPELQKIPEHDLLYNESKLHSTMLYIQENYKEGSDTISFPNRKTTIKGVEVWGTDNNNFYLVAVLNDPGSNLKKTYEQLKAMTNTLDERGLNPHISLQKTKLKEDLMLPEKLQGLIGVEVELHNFRCLLPKAKSIKPRL
jgi:hypothetical protein